VTAPAPTDAPTVSPALAALPNRLTLARLFLAVGCFVVLSVYDESKPSGASMLLLAAALFILAAATDALDGHLARRWRVVSPFGRIMDPLADKLLVIGAFVFLAGPGFTDDRGDQVTAVTPWMVIVIFAREMLATSIRAYVESRGEPFPAVWSGKTKMILQTICVPAVLVLVATTRAEPDWARWTIRTLVWATVLVTILSGWRYLVRTIAAVREPPGSPP
jgi:CDP-diacylglycerol--glycerol-3-phosphate 3-phosphatidyltransferase